MPLLTFLYLSFTLEFIIYAAPSLPTSISTLNFPSTSRSSGFFLHPVTLSPAPSLPFPEVLDLYNVNVVGLHNVSVLYTFPYQLQPFPSTQQPYPLLPLQRFPYANMTRFRNFIWSPRLAPSVFFKVFSSILMVQLLCRILAPLLLILFSVFSSPRTHKPFSLNDLFLLSPSLC